MLVNSRTVDHILDTAVNAVAAGFDGLCEALDQIPAAIYVTDKDGVVTYFNRASVEFAGRTPALGQDKWCVTWKLYTTEGEFLPHDECPMAVAIREKRPVRDVEAIAERPDGTRVNFAPYPTPWFDEDGNLAGAVNLLLDITRQRRPEYLREQAVRCRRLAQGIGDPGVQETLVLMAAKYEEQALKMSRSSPAED